MSESTEAPKASKRTTQTEVAVDAYPESEPRPYEDAKKKK